MAISISRLTHYNTGLESVCEALQLDKMAEDEAVSKPVQTFGAKHPLMAYSRHGRTLARNSHSLFEHLARVDSLNESDSKGAKQCMVEFDLCRRKRTRNIVPLTKTPTDVFWEHLSSSAAVLTHPQETGPSGPSFPIEAAQDAYGPPNDKEPYSVTASAVFIAKHGQRTPKISLGQRARNISSEVIAVKDAERDEQCSEEPHNGKSERFAVEPTRVLANLSTQMSQILDSWTA